MDIKRAKKKVVVVGGGTGIHALLKGFKVFSNELDITVIVNMSDSGGSTGRLRDEFGQLPIGDARMALVALSAQDDQHDELLRELFLYRFKKGAGLNGHNFGNLLLTALTDILGSEVEAITTASRILRVRGRVLPVTTDNVHLKAVYDDGLELVGEHSIDEPAKERSHNRITHLSLTPSAKLSDTAKEALATADMVILGPGDFYTSIIANCVVDGFKSALPVDTPLVYVCNLMSKAGQTIDMHAREYIEEIVKYLDRAPDHVLINTVPLAEELLSRYRDEDEHPVLFNCEGETSCTIHAEDFLASDVVTTKTGDTVRRSLIRHDGHKLATYIKQLLETT